MISDSRLFSIKKNLRLQFCHIFFDEYSLIGVITYLTPKFAKIIAEKDFKQSEQLNAESLTVLEILETARIKAGIKF